MQDAFDSSLKQVCSIMVRDVGAGNSYGVSSPAFVTLATNVPCRVALGRGRAKEYKAEKKTSRNYRIVYMRPWYADQAPDGSNLRNHVVGGTTYNTQPLTHDHWIQFAGQNYDAYQVENPGEIDHHLEVYCELILV